MDAELRADVKHRLGLLQARVGPLAERRTRRWIAGPRYHDVSMEVDDRPFIAEMATVRVVDAGDVVFGRSW